MIPNNTVITREQYLKLDIKLYKVEIYIMDQ